MVDVNDASTTSFCPRTPFAGTYSIGDDNRGVMAIAATGAGGGCSQQVWLTSNLANTTLQKNYFVFSIGQIQNISLSSGACTSGPSNTACPLYTDGNLVEFDDVGAWGVSGVMAPSYVAGGAHLTRQNLGQFSTLTNFNSGLAGNWVMGLLGEDLPGTQSVPGMNPLSAGGVLTIGTGTGAPLTGAISGIVDINDNGTAVSANTLGLTIGSATWQATGGTTGTYTMSNGRFKATIPVTNSPTGYPIDYVGYLVDSTHLLFLSSDNHSSASMMVSGDLYKQQELNYDSSALNGPFVTYWEGADHAEILQLTCSNAACTINSNDEISSGSGYVHNPFTGPIGTGTVGTNGRVTYTGTNAPPIIFYLYGTAAASGGRGALFFSTDSPQLGFARPQGTVPVSVDTQGTYYMGSSAFDTAASTGGVDSGAFTADNTGLMTGHQDEGGQGYTSWGGLISGMSLGAIDANGVFGIMAGSPPAQQVICYLVNSYVAPPLAQGSAALYVCMDTSKNPSPKLTLVQQTQ